MIARSTRSPVPAHSQAKHNPSTAPQSCWVSARSSAPYEPLSASPGMPPRGVCPRDAPAAAAGELDRLRGDGKGRYESGLHAQPAANRGCSPQSRARWSSAAASPQRQHGAIVRCCREGSGGEAAQGGEEREVFFPGGLVALNDRSVLVSGWAGKCALRRGGPWSRRSRLDRGNGYVRLKPKNWR